MRSNEVLCRRPWTSIGGFVDCCLWRAVCAAAGTSIFLEHLSADFPRFRQSDNAPHSDNLASFDSIYILFHPQKEALTKVAILIVRIREVISCGASSDAFWQPYLESTARCFARYPLIFIKRCAILSPVAAHKNKVVQGLQGGHRL